MAAPSQADAETKSKVRVSLPILAKMIDHSLLHPTMTDAVIEEGLEVARRYDTATACIKPYSIPLAKELLEGSDVGICPVIAFPHGNSSVAAKVAEAEDVLNAIGKDWCKRGKVEVDMVINIGKALGHDWNYIRSEIQAVNDTVKRHGAILKVIFENDYLSNEHITDLCHICTELGVAFVKTSTGYGFVKQQDGSYNYKGATHEHLRLMRKEAGEHVQIKAAGGVRTLDDLIMVMSLGVTRIGATATEAILEGAKRKGIGMEETFVEVGKVGGSENGSGGGAY